MHTIIVRGLASAREVARLEAMEDELELTLMEFLRAHKIPVASSCFGEGVCRKCVVKSGEVEFLSCLITVKTFLLEYDSTVSISYL